MEKTSRSEYINGYISKNYKRISLNVKKEEYEEIKAAAAMTGEKINAFIKQAIEDRLKALASKR